MRLPVLFMEPFKPPKDSYYVYIYTDPRKADQPFYIGKGKNSRAFAHLKEKYGRSYKYRKIKAMEMEGVRPNIFCAHVCVSEAQAFWLEQFLIALFGRKGYDPGGILTNVAKGGQGNSGWVAPTEYRQKMAAITRQRNLGHHPSEATKKKISDALKGSVLPEETRHKIAEANLGRKHTEEAKANMRRAQKGHPGHPASDEARAKMSAAGKGRKFSAEHKAKIGEANRRRVYSAETRAKIGAATRARAERRRQEQADASKEASQT